MEVSETALIWSNVKKGVIADLAIGQTACPSAALPPAPPVSSYMWVNSVSDSPTGLRAAIKEYLSEGSLAERDSAFMTAANARTELVGRLKATSIRIWKRVGGRLVRSAADQGLGGSPLDRLFASIRGEATVVAPQMESSSDELGTNIANVVFEVIGLALLYRDEIFPAALGGAAYDADDLRSQAVDWAWGWVVHIWRKASNVGAGGCWFYRSPPGVDQGKVSVTQSRMGAIIEALSQFAAKANKNMLAILPLEAVRTIQTVPLCVSSSEDFSLWTSSEPAQEGDAAGDGCPTHGRRYAASGSVADLKAAIKKRSSEGKPFALSLDRPLTLEILPELSAAGYAGGQKYLPVDQGVHDGGRVLYLVSRPLSKPAQPSLDLLDTTGTGAMPPSWLPPMPQEGEAADDDAANKRRAAIFTLAPLLSQGTVLAALDALNDGTAFRRAWSLCLREAMIQEWCTSSQAQQGPTLLVTATLTLRPDRGDEIVVLKAYQLVQAEPQRGTDESQRGTDEPQRGLPLAGIDEDVLRLAATLAGYEQASSWEPVPDGADAPVMLLPLQDTFGYSQISILSSAQYVLFNYVDMVTTSGSISAERDIEMRDTEMRDTEMMDAGESTDEDEEMSEEVEEMPDMGSSGGGDTRRAMIGGGAPRPEIPSWKKIGDPEARRKEKEEMDQYVEAEMEEWGRGTTVLTTPPAALTNTATPYYDYSAASAWHKAGQDLLSYRLSTDPSTLKVQLAGSPSCIPSHFRRRGKKSRFCQFCMQLEAVLTDINELDERNKPATDAFVAKLEDIFIRAAEDESMRTLPIATADSGQPPKGFSRMRYNALYLVNAAQAITSLQLAVKKLVAKDPGTTFVTTVVPTAKAALTAIRQMTGPDGEGPCTPCITSYTDMATDEGFNALTACALAGLGGCIESVLSTIKTQIHDSELKESRKKQTSFEGLGAHTADVAGRATGDPEAAGAMTSSVESDAIDSLPPSAMTEHGVFVASWSSNTPAARKSSPGYAQAASFKQDRTGLESEPTLEILRREVPYAFPNLLGYWWTKMKKGDIVAGGRTKPQERATIALAEVFAKKWKESTHCVINNALNPSRKNPARSGGPPGHIWGSTGKGGLPYLCNPFSIADAQSTCKKTVSAIGGAGLPLPTLGGAPATLAPGMEWADVFKVVLVGKGVDGKEYLKYTVSATTETVEDVPTSLQIFAKLEVRADPSGQWDSVFTVGSEEPAKAFKVPINWDGDAPKSMLQADLAWANMGAQVARDSDNGRNLKSYLSSLDWKDADAREKISNLLASAAVKGLGDQLQELTGVVRNGGYIGEVRSSLKKPDGGDPDKSWYAKPDTGRIVLSNDRPAALRTVLLLIEGETGINPLACGGYYQQHGYYCLGWRIKDVIAEASQPVPRTEHKVEMSLAAMATWVRLMYVIDPMHDFPVQKTLGDRGKKAREIFVELRKEEVRAQRKRKRSDEDSGQRQHKRPMTQGRRTATRSMRPSRTRSQRPSRRRGATGR